MYNNNDINNTFNILDLTFDDVKNNHNLMLEIRTKWDDLGFLENFENGEKRDNLCIAYEQVTECLNRKEIEMQPIFQNLKMDILFDNDINAMEDSFETIIIPIIARIYINLPLSDYDYKEIFDGLERILISDDELNIIKNNDCDKEAEMCALISTKINELILKKYND